MGLTIQRVYSKVSGRFAIYKADDKIFLQFADEGVKSERGGDLGEEQRKALAPLRSLRGSIDGYVRKLSVALGPVGTEERVEIEFYNQRIADALFNALQGNAPEAQVELEEIKSELLERLKSLGRVQFALSTLIASVVTLTVLTALVFFSARIEQVLKPETELLSTNILKFLDHNFIWAAALFGTLGAWFSIALNLRSSEAEVSTSMLDNFVNPTLRIIIAIISACLLFSIIRLGFFEISIGGKNLSWAPETPPGSSPGDLVWRGLNVAIIIAFVAGFTERLVGNILERASRDSEAVATSKRVAGMTPGSGETDPFGETGTNDRGTQTDDSTRTGEPGEGDDLVAPHPPDQQTLDTEITTDEQLPKASGGVATEDTNRGGTP